MDLVSIDTRTGGSWKPFCDVGDVRVGVDVACPLKLPRLPIDTPIVSGLIDETYGSSEQV